MLDNANGDALGLFIGRSKPPIQNARGIEGDADWPCAPPKLVFSTNHQLKNKKWKLKWKHLNNEPSVSGCVLLWMTKTGPLIGGQC